MKRTETQFSDLPWIDLVGPTHDDLLAISEDTGIPMRAFLNCLDSEHLPKYEILGDVLFVVLRVVEPDAKTRADTLQKLTTKISVFITPKAVLTIHRLDPAFFADLRDKVLADQGKIESKEFLRRLVSDVVNTYDAALDDIDHRTDRFEAGVFTGRHTKMLLKDGYLLRRKASAYRKALQLTLEVIRQMITRPEFAKRDFAEVRNHAERMLFYADEAMEVATSLLNLHIALASLRTDEASFRTNEIMRVLTVFSIFFMPLSFIASVYGMNFEHMPELHHPWGYPIVLIAMFLIAVGLYVWMKTRGWLNPVREEERGDHPSAH